MTIWHFFDFKGNQNAIEENTKGTGLHTCQMDKTKFPPKFTYVNTSSGRPCGINHKGLLDAWRRPKLAFHVSARYFNDYHNGIIHDYRESILGDTKLR